jgi:hypothetical protein
MNYIIGVEILNPLQCLSEKFECLSLSKYVFRILMIKEITNFCVLHDHMNAFLIYDGIPQFDYMRMIKLLMYIYFSLYKFYLTFGWNVYKVDLIITTVTIFRAYILQVFRCLANLTVPKEPHPIFLCSITWNSWIDLKVFLECILSIRNGI